MSGLFDSLSIASSALDAQRMGMDVVGQNIANINTPGYARRTLALGEGAPTDALSAGGGVDVVRVEAARNTYIESRIRLEQQGAQRDTAIADALSVVESDLGQPGQSLDAKITSFFDAVSTLASDATSSTSRAAVVVQGRQLAGGFNDMAGRLDTARRDADSALQGDVSQINQLAAQIASLNASISGANGTDVESLKDQETTALGTLAGLANITTTSRPDGAVDVSIGTGRLLVSGGIAQHIAAAPDSSGMSVLSINGADITSEITGGDAGGLLTVRDTLVPGYQQQLDQLAFRLASQVNAAHRAGFDATGEPGGDMFSVSGSATGAAAALAIDPALSADSSRIAASATGAAGDNQTAQAMAALRDQPLSSGSTATASDLWSQLVYTVGADSAAAQASQANRQPVIDQLTKLRDAASGVSIDSEAASLMKYQRAYEASARYFETINTTLTTLMSMVTGA